MRIPTIRSLRHGPIFVAMMLPALLTGCSTNAVSTTKSPVAVVNQPSTSPAPPEPEKSVSELIKELSQPEKEERLGMLRAWVRVPHHDHYRAAQASDFSTPFMTSDYGELAGAYGLAAMIVDKTLSTDCFSLVIFIRRPANRYDVYWIYRNMDLSKYRMSRASGDIFVNYPRSDGTDGICEIQWDRKVSRWACTGL